jgi:hypothetical protein
VLDGPEFEREKARLLGSAPPSAGGEAPV